MKRLTGQKVKPDDLLSESEIFIIKSAQEEIFGSELQQFKSGKNFLKNNPLLSLNPILDDHGILRLGGRFNESDLCTNYKNPVIISSKSYVARLLVSHYHQRARHHGRHFTEGVIRYTGFWIIGAKRLIRSIIHNCIKCIKLRGKFEIQQMADLPKDRSGLPFSSVWVDAFGPWTVIARKTLGGVTNAKRWTILFTCLTTRAIELYILRLLSSSFINALRRFIAVRGNVKEFRSDRGSNFVGSVNKLGIESINVEDRLSHICQIRELYGSSILHIPAHMGGIWERMIGITGRILVSMLMDCSSKNLTHEVLVIFLAEVSAIVNALPITPVSTDPEAPAILSPSMLLTQKIDSVIIPSVFFSINDMYKAYWKRVQALSDIFRSRWKKEYLQHLQKRTKVDKWISECYGR